VIDRVSILRGVAFQSFCGILLSLDDQGFQAVNGAGGDLGNDGFLLVGDTVYQAYGPDRHIAARVRAKIDDSIQKAVRLRSTMLPGLRRLVFLTPFDLTNDAHASLVAGAAAAGLQAESWGETKLTALLTKHPSVRSEFAEFLLPDIATRLDEIHAAILEGVPPDPLERIFGPDYEPNLIVLQHNVDPRGMDLQADEWLRVRIYSEALARDSFEPEEEDAFLDIVRDVFTEDGTASLEPSKDDRVLVEHRGANLRFHRRWGWWTDGVLGFAATLPDLTRQGFYSVADMAIDMVRVFRLLAQVARNGSARVVIDMDPHRLAPVWDLSDLRARGRSDAKLAGVLSPGSASGAHRTKITLEHSSTVASIVSSAEELTGDIVAKAARNLHSARVRKADIIACLPTLLATHLQIQER